MREVISFFYADPTSKFGEIVVDAFIHETHTLSSEITDHPVENGSVIADHIYNRPFTLVIDGIISNTPMNLVGLTAFDSAKRYLTGESNDVVAGAFDKIEVLFTKREPVTIATSLKIYDDMVLENLTVERGGGMPDFLQFKCTAKQIRKAQQQLIKIPTPKPDRAKPKKKKGLQETKTITSNKAEALKQKNSLVFSLGKKLFGS